jgi:hypothetical protein
MIKQYGKGIYALVSGKKKKYKGWIHIKET